MKDDPGAIHAHITVELRKEFKEVCERKGMKMKAVIKNLIQQYVERNKK